MEQIKLKCDWNVTTFCITSLKVNESKYNWEKVKKNLSYPNSSQIIYDLQLEITETFSG